MVSVLCARVRMEEKRLIEALAVAGVAAAALPPCSEPMPLGPSPLEPFADGSANGVAGSSASGSKVIVDRCQDRILAAALLPLLKAGGAKTIDAGLAATGDRLAIATALNRAGVARPRTLLATSEATGLAAFDALGVPSTLLPLDPGAPSIVLRDREIAEAVFEHRNVLGRTNDAVSLLQQGVAEQARLLILVAGGKAVAVGGDSDAALDGAVVLAEAAANALRAGLIGVEIAEIDGALVVWDVQPVPDYRAMRPLVGRSVDDALLDFVLTEAKIGTLTSFDGGWHVAALAGQEALDGIALSA